MEKVAAFEQGPEQEKALQRVQASPHAPLPVGPCDPAVATSVKRQGWVGMQFGAVGGHCRCVAAQAPTSRASPRPTDNSSPLEKHVKQLLVCSWPSVEVERFTTAHQVTVQPKPGVICSVGCEAWCARQHPVLRWRWDVQVGSSRPVGHREVT